MTCENIVSNSKVKKIKLMATVSKIEYKPEDKYFIVSQEHFSIVVTRLFDLKSNVKKLQREAEALGAAPEMRSQYESFQAYEIDSDRLLKYRNSVTFYKKRLEKAERLVYRMEKLIKKTLPAHTWFLTTVRGKKIGVAVQNSNWHGDEGKILTEDWREDLPPLKQIIYKD